MSGMAWKRNMAEFMRSMYPAFSRRATQVCVLSAALEKIARGAKDAQAIAHASLDEANAFDWKKRAGDAASEEPRALEYPAEPTPEMLLAGLQYVRRCEVDLYATELIDIYKAMRIAATQGATP